jgi:hypothetical protein
MREQRRVLSVKETAETPKTFLQKLLDGVETIGNKVPDPAVIFLIMSGLVIRQRDRDGFSFSPFAESKTASGRPRGCLEQAVTTAIKIGTPIKAPATPQSMPQKNTANSTMKGETETAVPATRGSM